MKMDDQYSTVSSELLGENDYSSNLKPTLNESNVVSKFKFSYPPPRAAVDTDGDSVVVRGPTERRSGLVEIEHSQSTILGLVGLQVWRGALLLAEWLLHNSVTLRNQCVLELGSGVGLSSIIAAIYAPVICTDINKGDILKLIKANVDRNKHLINYQIQVLELDFTEPLSQDITEHLGNISIIICADVIYDNETTEAFVETVKRILSYPPKKSIYIALEKRFVFTIADCDCVAPCYEYYLKCIRNLENVQFEQIPIDFPQYFDYIRVKELVLWKISSNIAE